MTYVDAVDENGHLTRYGHIMAEFPISPFHSRVLIASSKEFHCSEQVCTIVSLLAGQDLYTSSRNTQVAGKLFIK